MNQIKIYPTFEELICNIGLYNKNSNIKLIKTAFEFAKEHHGLQMRKSGHPYYYHPLSVANIVSLFKLDDVSIISALLHDVVEDTNITIDQIKIIFGDEVSKIVDGVTKLGNIKYRSEEIQQTENLRKLFLALSEDIRVLIIKLCDRLHNMMTIDSISSYRKKRAKAIETLEIYAPLAQRIGIYKIKDLLQDLSFKVINSRARNSVIKRIDDLKLKYSEKIDQVVNDVKLELKKNGIECLVDSRIKTNYSIWRKMQEKSVDFERINDVFGYRVILEKDKDCYEALRIIHSMYKYVGNFIDYISTPKENGYKSIHTFVIDKTGFVMEFQIRSSKMNEEAEFGFASHWGYKDGNNILSSEDIKGKWIKEILTILNSESSAKDILEYTKLEMYKDKIFAFTPKGDIVHLSKGSKILDFAFAVDSNLGNYFNGVKINGVFVDDFDTEIQNGDRIEIIKSDKLKVNSNWLKYANTGKAKCGIRKGILSFSNYQYEILGYKNLQKACQKRGIVLNEDIINMISKLHKDINIKEIYLRIHSGKIDPLKILDKIFGNFIKTNKDIKNKFDNNLKNLKPQRITIKEIPNIPFYLSKCCELKDLSNVIGVSYSGYGFFLHNEDCNNLSRILNINSVFTKISIKPDDFFETADISFFENDFYEETFLKLLFDFDISIKEKKIVYEENKPSGIYIYTIFGSKSKIEKFFNSLSKKFENIKIQFLKKYA